MSDTSLPVTPGSGVNVDGRTENGNGDFRQVIVIGDPSANAGVAPVDPVLGLSVQVTALPPGGIPVSNFPVTQPVSGAVSVTNLPATQPVSATTLPLPSGASTEATLALIKAKTDNIDVLLSSRTKPSDSQTIAGAVSVSNFPATQPVSAAALPLPSGASTETTLAAIKAKTDNLDVLLSTRTKPADTQVISAAALPLPSGASTAAKQPALGTAGTPSADVISIQGAPGMTPLSVAEQAASLVVSVTGTTGAAVTATLLAVAGAFHYIALIEIVKYFTVANAASATPLVVTTTNLPGSLAFTFGQPLGAIGVTDRMIHNPTDPVKSSVANTTIVCPATTGILWRVNVYYYAAA